MVGAVLVVAQPIGPPDQVAPARFEHAPDLAQMDVHVVWVEMLDHRGADGVVEGLVRKLGSDRVHLQKLDPGGVGGGQQRVGALAGRDEAGARHIDTHHALGQVCQGAGKVAGAAAEFEDRAVARPNDSRIDRKPATPPRGRLANGIRAAGARLRRQAIVDLLVKLPPLFGVRRAYPGVRAISIHKAPAVQPSW